MEATVYIVLGLAGLAAKQPKRTRVDVRRLTVTTEIGCDVLRRDLPSLPALTQEVAWHWAVIGANLTRQIL